MIIYNREWLWVDVADVTAATETLKAVLSRKQLEVPVVRGRC
jgi:hypothetical protein